MIKAQSKRHDDILDYLHALITNKQFTEKSGGIVTNVVLTFGWPDFLVTIYSTNVELIKNSIIVLRTMLEDLLKDVQIETSTIVGVSSDEIAQNSDIVEVKTIIDEYTKIKDYELQKTIKPEIIKKVSEYLSEKQSVP
jgi:hypothetical protein